jgi:hypothetical protein
VDCLGIIDEVGVILGRRLLEDAVQKRQNTQKMHTVPGAEPPKLMPPPSKFLNRSMLSRGLQRGGVEEGWMWFCGCRESGSVGQCHPASREVR